MDLKSLKEKPVVSEKMALMRKCETCYFCVDTKRVGGSSWCHCSNTARSHEGAAAMSWVRSRLNPICWRRTDSL